MFSALQKNEKSYLPLRLKSSSIKKKDESVLDKAVGIADARIKVDHVRWYVPRYTLSTQEQGTLSKQILKRTPTELKYFEQNVSIKEVKNQNLWNFEVGSQG